MADNSDMREAFQRWAKHLDSDGYFGALETFDEFLGPAIEALEKIAGFSYGSPVDKAFDAREALAAIRGKLK